MSIFDDMTPETYAGYERLKALQVERRLAAERKLQDRPTVGHTHFVIWHPGAPFCGLVKWDDLDDYEKVTPSDATLHEVSCPACRAVYKWFRKERQRRPDDSRLSMPDEVLQRCRALGVGEEVNLAEVRTS